MKTSPSWLQKFFDAKLPPPEVLAETLTFHTVEVEEVTPSYIDLKILPDRAAYMLCHRGAALELSAALVLPMKDDPLRAPVPSYPSTRELSVMIEDPTLCNRYMAALIRGVNVGPSPVWLKDALESVGQRSINNVVDATNYVMLNIGQPLHAFDASHLSVKEGTYVIQVRSAKENEKITTLSGEEHTLPEGVLLIADGASAKPLGIAGVKGGKSAEITSATTDIIIESANFDGTRIRRAAQALKLFTDASSRFQNRPSPALVAYGMRDVLALIEEIAGGTLVGVVDEYPVVPEMVPVTVSLARLNAVLGSSYTGEDVTNVFDRLGFSYTESEGAYTVLAPFERRDIVIPEDVIEEVGRVIGYEKIPTTQLPGVPALPRQMKYQGLERIKDFLVERGFIEISSQSFATEGEVELANPLQQDKPWLRASLLPSMKDALTRAVNVAPRVLGPAPLIKIFELGTVFTQDDEFTVLALGIEAQGGKGAAEALKEYAATIEQEILLSPGRASYALDGKSVEFRIKDKDLLRLGEVYEPARISLGAYQSFSLYPFALRDIAVWTPSGTTADTVLKKIQATAGPLLIRADQFDSFEKENRISYAFRLVFESMDKTLSDTDIDPVMKAITDALNSIAGFEVR
jgi:phenylalanyl-tRNA synthetase beta chain